MSREVTMGARTSPTSDRTCVRYLFVVTTSSSLIAGTHDFTKQDTRQVIDLALAGRGGDKIIIATVKLSRNSETGN